MAKDRNRMPESLARSVMVRKTFLIVACAIAIVMTQALAAHSVEPKKEVVKPINYPKSSIPKEDESLKLILKLTPLTERDIHIPAKMKVVEYLFTRPTLAYRLLELFGGKPATLEEAEEGNEWDVKINNGGLYTFETVWIGNDRALLKFGYFYRAAIGIGIKFSGLGAVIVRMRPDPEEKDAMYIDFDIYAKPGDLPLDKLLKAAPVHREWFRSDFMTIASSFIELCKTADDDPESVADDMAEADDLFTEKEAGLFRKTFVTSSKK